MSDHFATSTLAGLRGAGALGALDFGDYAALAAEAAADPEGMTGRKDPPDYDPGSVYANMMSARLAYELNEDTYRIDRYFSARETVRHSSAKAAIMSASGASDEDYLSAVTAREQGDPSPLLAMQVKYLSTI